MTAIPNPGSADALAAGCKCPVLDNNHGRFPVYTDDDGDHWWRAEGCPLHDLRCTCRTVPGRPARSSDIDPACPVHIPTEPKDPTP